MSGSESSYATTPIEADDAKSDFASGKHALDDYFARHAFANDQAGIGRAYVLRRSHDDPPELPDVLGFYTLSMAGAESSQIATALEKRLPKYPMPVALIGRLAVDARAHGKRLGEKLLVDALRRVVDAATLVGCTGVIVDAKDEDAEGFYLKYDFVTVSATACPTGCFSQSARRARCLRRSRNGRVVKRTRRRSCSRALPCSSSGRVALSAPRYPSREPPLLLGWHHCRHRSCRRLRSVLAAPAKSE